jgi:hypothetical protein
MYDLIKPMLDHSVTAAILAVMVWWMIRERKFDRQEAAQREVRLGARLDQVEDEYRTAILQALNDNARALRDNAAALRENAAANARLLAVIEHH